MPSTGRVSAGISSKIKKFGNCAPGCSAKHPGCLLFYFSGSFLHCGKLLHLHPGLVELEDELLVAVGPGGGGVGGVPCRPGWFPSSFSTSWRVRPGLIWSKWLRAWSQARGAAAKADNNNQGNIFLSDNKTLILLGFSSPGVSALLVAAGLLEAGQRPLQVAAEAPQESLPLPVFLFVNGIEGRLGLVGGRLERAGGVEGEAGGGGGFYLALPFGGMLPPEKIPIREDLLLGAQ